VFYCIDLMFAQLLLQEHCSIDISIVKAAWLSGFKAVLGSF